MKNFDTRLFEYVSYIFTFWGVGRRKASAATLVLDQSLEITLCHTPPVGGTKNPARYMSEFS